MTSSTASVARAPNPFMAALCRHPELLSRNHRRTIPDWERVNDRNENAPIGALNFFVHGVAIYATFEVLHRINLCLGASRTGNQLTRSI
jgi:hypothetical protein